MLPDRRHPLLGLLLMSAACVPLVWVLSMIVSPGAVSVSDTTGGRQVLFAAERAAVGLPGQCVPVRWQVEGVSAVYLDREGVAGQGEAQVCPAGDSRPTLLVVFPDGSRQAYALQIAILAYSGAAWLALGGGLGLLLLGLWLGAGDAIRPRVARLARGASAALGIGLLVLLAHFAVAPGPLDVQRTAGGATIFFHAERRWTVLSEGCVAAAWELDGIRAVYLRKVTGAARGVSGQSERALCGYDQPWLEVTLPDGTLVSTPPVRVLATLPEAWLLLVAALSLILPRAALGLVRRLIAALRGFRPRPALAPGARPEIAAALRVAGKALTLFVVLNVLFAAVQPLPLLGRLSLYNLLFAGRPRLPFSNTPQEAYNLTTDNIEAMFAAHAIAVPKPVDEFRVVLLGESATWGWLLRPEETLAGQLNALGLRAADGRRVRVYNLSYPRPSLTKDLLLLDYALDYAPDLVLLPVTLYSLSRDQFTTLEASHPAAFRALADAYGLDWQSYAERFPDRPWLERTIVGERQELNQLLTLQLYGVLWSATGIDQAYPPAAPRLIDQVGAVDETPGDNVQAVDPVGLQVIEAVRARAGSVPVLVINTPIYIAPDGRGDPASYNDFYPRTVYDEYRALLGQVAADEGWHYVDLWTAVDPAEFTDTPLHYSTEGARQFALALYDALRQLVGQPSAE